MLQLYNSLGFSRVPFAPSDPTHVPRYMFGPTPYSYAHTGNAQPAVIFDVLARVLRAQTPNLTYARNITDIDDKIIAAAAARSTS